jgi:hypothetical protein
METIDSPSGIFFKQSQKENDNNISDEFSFSMFNMGKPQVKQTIKIEDIINTIDSKIEIYKGIKIDYKNFDDLKFDNNTSKITIKPSFLLTKEEKDKRDKENKIKQENLDRRRNDIIAFNDTMDFFGNTDKQKFEDDPEELDNITTELDIALSILENNVVVNKTTKSIQTIVDIIEENGKQVQRKGEISVIVFFDNLLKIFNYINSEERGKLLINLIFGGLISTFKLSGSGYKPASEKFDDLISAINNLTTGGKNPEQGAIYTKIFNLIIYSDNLTRYRLETMAGEQVKNIIDLIKKLSLRKYPVYFPLDYVFKDPINYNNSTTKSDSTKKKSALLNGIPDKKNLVNFFLEKVVKVKKEKKNKYDDNDDDYDDPDGGYNFGGKGR